MPFIDTLRQAHIHSHRVGHACNKLTDAEEAVYQRLKRDRKRELTVGGLTARLEPKRFGVNWRQELVNVLDMPKMPARRDEYLDRVTAAARERTERARELFEKEAPNWRDDTRPFKRLVIEG